MAFSTNDMIRKYGAGPDAIDDGTTAAIANGEFSLATDVSVWTNNEDAPNATFILNATFGTAPTANTTIDLFAKLDNIDGTVDSPEPGTGSTQGNHYAYLGSFPVDDGYGTSAFAIWLECELPGMKSSQEYVFYLKNNGGQSINANWDLDIQTWTVGPQ